MVRWRPFANTALGLTSLVVLAATGYGWIQLHRLSSPATADVIEPAARLPATGPSVPVPEQNILLVGIDSRTDVQGRPLPRNVLDELHGGDPTEGGNTTDTMIVVHIPAGGGSATAISLPRDSYVELADGYGKHKINSAYSRGRQDAVNRLSAQGVQGPELERQADVAGARLAIRTVEQLTGLTINHYGAVNLVGFSTVSLAVGGVPVCLRAPVHDSYSGADFPAGEQMLSGADALAFVRQRHGLAGGDLDRIARQQAFLSSMARVVLGAGTLANPSKVGALVDAVQRSVVIDNGWNLLDFAEQLRGLSAGALTFATIPVQNVNLQTPDGDAVKVDPGEVRSFVGTLIEENKGRGTSTSGGARIRPVARTDSFSPPGTESGPPQSSSVPGTANSTSGKGADLTGCVN